MTKDTGIIDKKRNPFYCESWRVQNYSMNNHRKEKLKKLLEQDEGSIKNMYRNIGAYPVFLVIRWGFA